jgi:pyroglutamyl-peptidase
MKTILLTGFKPFENILENPSEIIVKNLDGQIIENYVVCTHVFDVIYETTFNELKSLIKTLRPNIILHLGVAEKRKVLSLERVAINFRSNRTDNSGQYPSTSKIIDHLQNAYFSNLDLEEILQNYSGSIPLEISNTAGTFLCNQVLYQSLYLIESEALNTKVGFLHVPQVTSETIPELTKSVQEVISKL